MERKTNFNFPLPVEEGKKVKRAQVEFSESMGVKEFYGRALVAGAELLLSQRTGDAAPAAVSEAAYMAETEAAKEKAKRERKAAAERERRRLKREGKQ